MDRSAALLTQYTCDVADLTDYTQYFTLADRLGHSYRQPASELDPMLDIKKAEAAKRK